MPYLLKVGPERYRVTKTGQPVFASRVYWVFRRGKHVTKRFGGVRVVGSRRNKIELKHGWHHSAPEVMRDEREARRRVKEIVAAKVKDGWKLLPPGRRIVGTIA